MSSYDDPPQTTNNDEPVSPDIVQLDPRERIRKTDIQRNIDREALADRYRQIDRGRAIVVSLESTDGRVARMRMRQVPQML